MFDMNYRNPDRNFIYFQVRQNQSKRIGSNKMYMNSFQVILQNNYQINFARSQQAVLFHIKCKLVIK